MGYPDLIEARKHLRALEDLVSNHEGGTGDPVRAACVELLCGSAARAASDAIYLHKLDELRSLAANFFSANAHERWGRPSMSGLLNLRLQIIKTMNALDTRLRQVLELRLAAANGLPSPGWIRVSSQPVAPLGAGAPRAGGMKG